MPTKPKRWKPKKGEWFFAVREIRFPKSDPTNSIGMYSYHGDATDRKYFQTGNMFRTADEAVRAYKAAIQAVSEIFLNLAEQKGEESEGEKALACGLHLSDGELALIRAIRKTGVLCTWKRKSAALVYEAAGELVSRNDVVAFFTDGTYADDDEIRAALDAISREQGVEQKGEQ